MNANPAKRALATARRNHVQDNNHQFRQQVNKQRILAGNDKKLRSVGAFPVSDFDNVHQAGQNNQIKARRYQHE